MGNNLIFPFGQVATANVATDADWQADPTALYGFTAGRAPSKKGNKAWKQAINPASGLGQFTADWSGLDFHDGLSPAAMSINLRMAIAAAMDGTRMGVDVSSAANQIAFQIAPLPPSLTGNRIFWFKPAVTNTGSATATILKADGTAAFPALNIKRRDGQDPQSGDLVAGAWYGATSDGTKLSLLAPVRSEIISGASPSGSFTPLPGITIASDTPYIDWTPPAGYDFFRLTGMFKGPVLNVVVLLSRDGTTFLPNGSVNGGYGQSGNSSTPYYAFPGSNGPGGAGFQFSAVQNQANIYSMVQAVMCCGTPSIGPNIVGFQWGYDSSIPAFTQIQFSNFVATPGRLAKMRFIISQGGANNILGGSYIGVEGFKYS